MPVAVVRPREEVIAEEHEYLFHPGSESRQGPQWNRAACRGADPEVFFPISPRDTVSRTAALAYCAQCVVRIECLQTALSDRSLVGIWGGTDEEDRARLRRRLR